MNAYASMKAWDVANQLKCGAIFDLEWAIDYFSRQCGVKPEEFETLVKKELKQE